MRKMIMVLAIGATLALAGSAAAASVNPPNKPTALCGSGNCLGGGGGFTGCSSTSGSRSANIGLASVNHYVVVNYCKSNGTITSISIAAHGCDTNGLITCDAGPAWVSSGGVGSTSATVEAHATWRVFKYVFSNTDVIYASVPTG